MYPFSAGALGVADEYLVRVNETNALYSALRRIERDGGWQADALFMTDQNASHHGERGGMRYRYFPVSWRPRHRAAGFGRQWSVQMCRAIIREHPDIVFLFIGSGWFAILLAAVCRALAIPYCPIIAGWGTSTRRSLRWYYAHAFRTIVHTEAHRTWFQQSGIDVRNFMVMPMGVDTDLFVQKSKDEYPHNGRPPRMIHVGRIQARKNLLTALEAFSDVLSVFPEAVFDVVGPPGDEDYNREVSEFVRGMRLGDHVHFHGEVPNAMLPRLYAAADLMLFPTLSESFGFVIAESMACGTPVVALRGCGSPDEIIDSGRDGILTDVEHFASSATSLLKRPGDLMQMGLAARRKVEEKYSATKTYHQLLGLLDQCSAAGR